ncbi:MAG: L,D-transpeptidase family protein [Hyphomicrobium sp.]
MSHRILADRPRLHLPTGRNVSPRACRCVQSWFTALAMLGVLLVLPGPAGAQRQRALPPEPSRTAWISAAAEQRMQAAIDRYRQIVAAGGWPRFPDRATLRPGDSGANVVTLRQRLKASGDLAASTRNDTMFDSDVEAAVKRYQSRNGLEPTGIVFGITQRSLNVPADTRLKQLETNLARMQGLTPRLAAEPRHIVMNSASFELQASNGGQIEVVTRTIAGKRATPTPVVSATVRAINILPYWHVPGSIAKAALVPAVRKDPSYLYKERIRVFSSFGGEEVDPATINWWGPEAERYVFRQDPGPQNALGVLRFDMPNKHIVYMHDTPMKGLFDYFERAYSAGCVRLHGYLELAAWIIDGQPEGTRAALEGAIAAGVGKTIKAARPVPVHFIYLTAWADEQGVQFRNDLYNQDEGSFATGEEAGSRVLIQSIAP